jgi:putative lipoic acid-binding regulatory protein
MEADLTSARSVSKNMEILQAEIVQIRSESIVSYKMLQNLQNEMSKQALGDKQAKATERLAMADVETPAMKNLHQRVMLEVEKVKTDLQMHQQKIKVMEVKNDEFQDEVYKTVQNLSKEMNDAFTLLHKNSSLSKNVQASALHGLVGKNEQVEAMNKVIDQNVRNLYSALEKHKLLLEDKFRQYELHQERVKAQVQSLETEVNIQDVKNQNKRLTDNMNSLNQGVISTVLHPHQPGAVTSSLSGEATAKLENFEKQITVVHEKIAAMDRHVANLNTSLEDVVRQVE